MLIFTNDYKDYLWIYFLYKFTDFLYKFTDIKPLPLLMRKYPSSKKHKATLTHTKKLFQRSKIRCAFCQLIVLKYFFLPITRIIMAVLAFFRGTPCPESNKDTNTDRNGVVLSN